MNQELYGMYQADLEDHTRGLQHGTPAYDEMRARDRGRRARVRQLLAQDLEAADLYHAAWILNHGDAPEDAWEAHRLASDAATRGHAPARWLSAASFDRWRMYQGLPQKYGTQFVSDGRRHRLWDVEPGTTDTERAALDVPPLADQLERAEALTRDQPPGPLGEGAPDWLLGAIARWASSEG